MDKDRRRIEESGKDNFPDRDDSTYQDVEACCI